MSEKNQVIFKTVLMGCEKQSVLNYIDQICTMFHTESEKQAAEAENLRQENERLLEQAEKLNGQLSQQDELLGRQEEQLRAQSEVLRKQEELLGKGDAVSEQLSDKDQEIAQLKARLNALTKDLEKSRQLLGQKEDALTYLRAQSEQMVNRQKEMMEKGRKYDIISTNVGSIVLEAEHTANQIVKNANEEAERVRGEANAAANQMGEHLREFRKELEKMQESVFLTVKNLKDNFSNMTDTLDQSERFLFSHSEVPVEKTTTETEAGEPAAVTAE